MPVGAVAVAPAWVAHITAGNGSIQSRLPAAHVCRWAPPAPCSSNLHGRATRKRRRGKRQPFRAWAANVLQLMVTILAPAPLQVCPRLPMMGWDMAGLPCRRVVPLRGSWGRDLKSSWPPTSGLGSLLSFHFLLCIFEREPRSLSAFPTAACLTYSVDIDYGSINSLHSRRRAVCLFAWLVWAIHSRSASFCAEIQDTIRYLAIRDI